ncbi:hypothetical protein OA408_00495 [Acidimicrobiaceae bacterium]|nr:hypothetical protein [Acidimicrobiaceae bacterium]
MGFGADVSPEKITSDLRFYEINTCEISLIDFLIKNPNVVYQDHYKIRFNNYSSMKCFGTITGIDQINHVFFISIGTSSNINLVLQSIIWFTIISFIRKKRDIKFSTKLLLSMLTVPLIIISMIYEEERLYLKSLYFHDYNDFQHFTQLFLTIFFIVIISYYILYTRIDVLSNYFPYLFLVIGVYSGFNFNFFTIGALVFGTKRILINKKIWINGYYLLFLLFLWANNSYNKEFFVDPDKIRGFSSSIFTSYGVFSYSLFFIILINGLVYIFELQDKFKLKNYLNNFFYTSFLVFIFGFIGSGMPFLNFLNYYFFGLNKYGINRSTIFGSNEWGERLAWRGQFPSAETIGEFFAFGLFIYIYLWINKKIEFDKLSLVFLPVAVVGLLASNNRAALVSLFICITILIFKNNFQQYTKILIFFIFLIFTIILIGLNNLTYSLDYLGDSLLNDAIYYSLDEGTYSSSINYFLELKESKSFWYFLLSLFSIFGFYINRSELWGIFFARHNPEFQEVLFGSGISNFGQLYGDININPTYSFLLPHSGILSLYLFIGIINLIILILFIFKVSILKIRNSNSIFIYLAIFALLNLIKSDSLLYFPSFVNYLFFFYSAHKLEKSYI